MRNRLLGLNWELSPASGWGLVGLKLALEVENDGQWCPVPLFPPCLVEWVDPSKREVLEKVFARGQDVRKTVDQDPRKSISCPFPVLHALGNGLVRPQSLERIIGTLNVAFVVIEDARLDADALAVSGKFDLLLAGSSWNTRVLRARGLANVERYLQGVDLSLFHPNPRRGGAGKRFTIFSGGKLEYRKGQDIVIAAFRIFQRRHPDALLVTAWHNLWPNTMQNMDYRGHVVGLPNVDAANRQDICGWLEKNGIPRSTCYDVGLVPNHLLAEVYEQIEVALFPNRCEGGTNLVAMECMACGLPTILSANSGHLDLIDEGHCYPLLKQGPVPAGPYVSGAEYWGESDVDEVVEVLERVYQDRDEAAKRGAAAARFMETWSWRRRFEELVEHLEDRG